VMVYSEFVWSGVVPLAIALEHAGLSRYGENNMLATRTKVAPAGSYAILSGTNEVMGRKSFTEILEAVNAPNNRNGDKVKVILLTQVASEGLTLKNVREVHIVEPWYHFNQLEQVIGRAVRTCSHEALPLEDRNVTVFLHCATAKEGPTPDEHAYEIAARKLGQIELVEKVLRDNAVDCALNVNVNYVQPSTFGFGVQLRTSQGAAVDWTFGDSADLKPKCKSTIDLAESMPVSAIRHLEPIMPTALARIRAFLASVPAGTRIPIADVVAASKLPANLAKAALLRITEARIHGNAVIVQHGVKRAHGKLIEIAEPAEHAESAERSRSPGSASVAVVNVGPRMYAQLLSMLPSSDNEAKFTLYSMFIRSSFFQFATDVVSGVVPPTERAVRLLGTEGTWIQDKQGAIVGFVNIFTPRAVFEVYKWEEGRLDRASKAQTETYKKERQFKDVPQKAGELIDTIGFFGLKRDRAAVDDNVQIVFQLLMPNSLPGNQRGAFCETKGKDELKSLITLLNKDFFTKQASSSIKQKQYEFRKTLCAVLGTELHKHGVSYMMYPPYYK